MKTNQIFNFKRFTNYATSSFVLHYRSILLQLGVASAGVFLVCLFALNQYGNQWSYQNWAQIIFFLILIAGVLYIGSSFPGLRTREKTQSFLMVPSSSCEKFVYEITEKFILLLVVFPVVVYVFGNLAVPIINVANHARWNGVSAPSLSYYEIINQKWTYQRIWIVFWGAIALFSLAFAGAATFRKNPLIKTVVFVGAVIAAIVTYCYLIFEKMRLISPWMDGIRYEVADKQKENIVVVLLLLMGTIMLAYAFFKLKEREVQ